MGGGRREVSGTYHMYMHISHAHITCTYLGGVMSSMSSTMRSALTPAAATAAPVGLAFCLANRRSCQMGVG